MWGCVVIVAGRAGEFSSPEFSSPEFQVVKSFGGLTYHSPPSDLLADKEEKKGSSDDVPPRDGALKPKSIRNPWCWFPLRCCRREGEGAAWGLVRTAGELI